MFTISSHTPSIFILHCVLHTSFNNPSLPPVSLQQMVVMASPPCTWVPCTPFSRGWWTTSSDLYRPIRRPEPISAEHCCITSCSLRDRKRGRGNVSACTGSMHIPYICSYGANCCLIRAILKINTQQVLRYMIAKYLTKVL